MSILKGSEDLVARAFNTVTLQRGPSSEKGIQYLKAHGT